MSSRFETRDDVNEYQKFQWLRRALSYGPRKQGAYPKEFYTMVKTAYTFAG